MIDLNRILCPIDFSPFSDRALRYAMRLAHWYDAHLHVLHVASPPSLAVSADLAAAARALTQKTLDLAIERERLHGVEVTTAIVESTDPTTRILETAESFDADLVVTGSHGRAGVQRVLLGSVVEALLHKSGRPIFVVPSHIDPDVMSRAISFGRIVCAVDFAVSSLSAVAYAMSVAEEADARLTLLHVIETPPELMVSPQPPDFSVDTIRAAAEQTCQHRLAELIPVHAQEFCTVETTVLEGAAARQILRLAGEQQADLIVLGVHGRSAFDLAFFGSNSKDVIRQARCPVLVVPASAKTRLRREPRLPGVPTVGLP